MLGTWLFVAFWVLIGLAVFFVAARGGLGGARATFQSQAYGARRAARVGFTTVYVAFGVAIPALFLAGNHRNTDRRWGAVTLTSAEKRGQTLFGMHCAVCHTLAAANAVGKVGPNLDQIKPTETLALHTIIHGCVQNPPPGSSQSCLGYGTMPPAILAGQDAQDVAKFVAAVAGTQ